MYSKTVLCQYLHPHVHQKILTVNSFPVFLASVVSSSFPGTESGSSDRPTWPVWLLRPMGFSGSRNAGNEDKWRCKECTSFCQFHEANVRTRVTDAPAAVCFFFPLWGEILQEKECAALFKNTQTHTYATQTHKAYTQVYHQSPN